MKNLYQYITESIQTLYHFTNVENLIEICKDDSFRFSSDDGINKGYKYFMSLSRQCNAFTGYPQAMFNNKIVRIVMDADALKSKFRIRPIEFNGRPKRLAVKSTWDDKQAFDDNYETLKLQTMVENEDRVFTNQRYLKDFHKYIKSIQIDIMTVKDKEIHLFQDYCDKYNIPLELLTPKQFQYGRK